MRTGWLLILIGFNVFWGGTYSAFKDLGNWLNPGQVVTLRYGVAAVLLLLCWPLMPGKSPRGWDLFKTALMGTLVFVCGPRLQVGPSQAGLAGDMAVLIALEPLVTTIGAAIFLRELIPANRKFGLAFGVIGVLLLAKVWQSDFQAKNLGLYLLFIGSFFCESAYSVMGKPLIERAGFMKVTTLALVAGVVVNLLFDGHGTVVAAQKMPVRGWLEIAYLATICTAIGYGVWFAAMRVLPVNAVAMTVFAQTFAGAAASTLLLGEQPHWGQLWGGLAIATGLALGLRKLGSIPADQAAAAPEIPK